MPLTGTRGGSLAGCVFSFTCAFWLRLRRTLVQFKSLAHTLFGIAPPTLCGPLQEKSAGHGSWIAVVFLLWRAAGVCVVTAGCSAHGFLIKPHSRRNGSRLSFRPANSCVVKPSVHSYLLRHVSLPIFRLFLTFAGLRVCTGRYRHIYSPRKGTRAFLPEQGTALDPKVLTAVS